MSKRVNIGIIGAGVFGGYHAQKIIAHPQAQLIGIYDSDYKRAVKLATTQNTRAFKKWDDILNAVEALIIASPATAHGADGLRALNAGKHVLIEKPLAADIHAAENIIARGQTSNLRLQVGHQERYILKAIGLDKITEKPVRIETQRFAPFSPRGTDVSVTLDLMIHDLDLVLWLLKAPPLNIKGYTQICQSETPDASLAHLQFDTTSVRLETSRIEPSSRRIFNLKYAQGEVLIDFNAKSCIHTTPFDLNTEFFQDSRAKDALGAADNDFIFAVLNGTDVPITGKDGLAALEIALAIDNGYA